VTKREAMQWIDQAKLLGYQRQGIALLEELKDALSFIKRGPVEEWELKLCDAWVKKGKPRCAGQGQMALRFSEANTFGECPVCRGWSYVRQRGERRGQMAEHVPLVDELTPNSATL
jgi:hypothetical protein